MARNLSKQEARLILELEWSEKSIISRSEIIQSVNESIKTADRLIISLRRKNWLEKIGSGKYMLIPAERGPEGVADMNTLLIGSLATYPYYFSYSTANVFHNLSPQARREMFIACRRKLRPKLVRGFMFRFIYLIEDKFFGYTETDVFGVKVMMADPEKAVVDSVDKPDYAGGIPEVAGVLARASRKCDWEKAIRYVLKMGSISLIQRLGYLIDYVGIEISAGARKKLKKRIKKHSRTYLGPVRVWGGQGSFNSEWQIIVNIPQEQLTAEI